MCNCSEWQQAVASGTGQAQVIAVPGFVRAFQRDLWNVRSRSSLRPR